MRLHNQNGVGIPLVASFNNGIVTKFINGISMDNQEFRRQVREEDFVRWVFMSFPNVCNIANRSILISIWFFLANLLRYSPKCIVPHRKRCELSIPTPKVMSCGEWWKLVWISWDNQTMMASKSEFFSCLLLLQYTFPDNNISFLQRFLFCWTVILPYLKRKLSLRYSLIVTSHYLFCHKKAILVNMGNLTF